MLSINSVGEIVDYFNTKLPLKNLLKLYVSESICEFGILPNEFCIGQSIKQNNPQKYKSWLLGRNAIKGLFNNEKLDSSEIRFPHKQISLSHSGGFAVCVFYEMSTGIGIDFETHKIINDKLSQRIVKFSLQAQEIDKFVINQSVPPLLLWSVKEAIFKSDMNNNNLTLQNYEITELCDNRGFASKNNGVNEYQFAYLVLKEGVLALSLKINSAIFPFK